MRVRKVLEAVEVAARAPCDRRAVAHGLELHPFGAVEHVADLGRLLTSLRKESAYPPLFVESLS